MRALVIADHNPHIDIPAVAQSEAVDLIITLGDLTTEDLAGLKRITALPKIGVYGNHDSGTYMPELGIVNVHLNVWDFQGKRFGGFQGCVRYKENPDALMYTQDEAVHLMAGFPKVDYFISHCPPRGINDEPEIAHQGFDALRSYLDSRRPTAWLHGHTYPAEDSLITMHGTTCIEYVSHYRIIDLPEPHRALQ